MWGGGVGEDVMGDVVCVVGDERTYGGDVFVEIFVFRDGGVVCGGGGDGG